MTGSSDPPTGLEPAGAPHRERATPMALDAATFRQIEHRLVGVWRCPSRNSAT